MSSGRHTIPNLRFLIMTRRELIRSTGINCDRLHFAVEGIPLNRAHLLWRGKRETVEPWTKADPCCTNYYFSELNGGNNEPSLICFLSFFLVARSANRKSRSKLWQYVLFFSVAVRANCFVWDSWLGAFLPN